MCKKEIRPYPVAITGLGAVSPYGSTVDRFWKALAAGEHAFAPITLFPAREHRTQVAAEIRKLPDTTLIRLDIQTLSRADLLAIGAARHALIHSQYLDETTGRVSCPDRMAVVVGTAAGAILGSEEFFRRRAASRLSDDSMSLISSFCLSAIATNIAKEYGIDGPRLTTATVCSSSALALAAAKELLQHADMDAVLVVGAETLSQVSHSGFNSLRSIAPDLCRPFDLNRKGLILGEGAGAMVLENCKEAHRRRVPVLAYLRGYGITTDTHHFTAPQPEGEAIGRTIRDALDDSGVGPERVSYINAHGTGTKLNDVAETRGIRAAVGPAADRVTVSSTKSMIGHQLGAASILEAIATVKSMESGLIHPTANLETPDPDCDLDYASDGSRHCDMDCALSNSFAFGGSDISLIFSKTLEERTLMQSPVVDVVPSAVITGIGVVSPTGIGKEAFFHHWVKGHPVMTGLESIGPEWRSFRGALADMAAVHERTPTAIRRRLNRQTSFLYLAFHEAAADAGLNVAETNTLPFVYGSAFGCSGNVQKLYSQLLQEGPKFVSPMEFNMSVTNAPPSLIAHQFGMNGPIWVFVGDEASWDISLHWADMLIQAGKTDQVAVCGAEEITDSVMAIHHELGLLETEDKKGIVLGEGAVCMMVESESFAQSRGARVYGTIRGRTTIQDTSCGPQDYSQDAGRHIQAVDRCMGARTESTGRLLYVSPANGSDTLNRVIPEVLNGLRKIWNQDVRTIPIRSQVGESGISGGLGLAGALLDSGPESHILVLTSGRGGTCAATFIQKGKSAPHAGKV